MLKLKFNGINENVKKLINDLAEHLQMYEPRLPEESQCTGYHVVKEMCLMKEEMCSLEDFEFFQNNPYIDKKLYTCPTGYYLLTQIHPNARRVTLNGVKKVREFLAKGQAGKVVIKKKV